MTPYEVDVMIEQVLSPARFHDPLVMAIGDVWVDQVPEIRDAWKFVPGNGEDVSYAAAKPE